LLILTLFCWKSRLATGRVKTDGATSGGRILAIFIWRGEAIRAITAYVPPMALQKLYLEGERVWQINLRFPDFNRARKEARWWFDHREETALWLARAAGEGRTSSLAGILEKRRQGGHAPPVSIRIDPADLSRARAQAERRGLRYQTYLKMVLHEALEREDRRQAG
jgi:hypothetical protein